MSYRSCRVFTTPEELKEASLVGRSFVTTTLATEDEGFLDLLFCDACGKESTDPLTMEERARGLLTKIKPTRQRLESGKNPSSMTTRELYPDLNFSDAALDILVDNQHAIIDALTVSNVSTPPIAETAPEGLGRDPNMERAAKQWYSEYQEWKLRRDCVALNLAGKGQQEPLSDTQISRQEAAIRDLRRVWPGFVEDKEEEY
jgi:hypothetical protein